MMKRILKRIRNNLIALISAGIVALVAAPTAYKQNLEMVKAAHAYKLANETLEQKLERITRFLKEHNLKFAFIQAYDWGLSDRGYLLVPENLDKDGKTDYVLLVGERGDENFPFSAAEYYLEDRSKHSGTGNVDVLQFYIKTDDGKKIVRFEKQDLERQIILYLALERMNDPKHEEVLRKAAPNIDIKKKFFYNADARYSVAIVTLDTYLRPAYAAAKARK
jgi:hypothetical protein